MSITEFAVKNRTVTWLIVFLLVIFGLTSYNNLGKLEDPEFTIKSAVIATQYPGASPEQVEQEVTERIETALQEMAEIDYLKSLSRAGSSLIIVNIKGTYRSHELPQIWDILRRKIRNIENTLPVGASRPAVFDDSGDVYGFLLAVTGDGYSYKALEKEVKRIKRELSLVEGVARVNYWGKQQRAVYLQVSEARLAQLGVSVNDVARALNQQNTLAASGKVYYDELTSRIEVTGNFNAIEDVKNLTLYSSLPGRQGQLIALRDIANVVEENIPNQPIMRYNGKQAITLAISNVSGANIIKLGEKLDEKIVDLQSRSPIGIDINKVAWQAEEVNAAINSFNVNLIEAVLIVLVIIALVMGWRMGVVIATALILTVLGTLVIMGLMGIDLHRMSLGALVIALGMMVDNAIVVGDGAINRMRQGMDKTQAAIESARGPSWPLLGATIIAVLAFYPIGGSTESVGEYCLALLQVVAISLLCSWVVSMTVTPLQCISMLKVSDQSDDKDAYSSSFYRGYQFILESAIRYKVVTISLMVGLLIVSGWGFQFITQSFFPDSSRAQFMIDLYAPIGTRITKTSELVEKTETKILEMEGVTNVSSYIGAGPPRFYLPVEPEYPFSSYAQLIVSVDDFSYVDPIIQELQPWLNANILEASSMRIRKFAVGPGSSWKFELRVSAPADTSLDEVRAVGEQGLAMLRENSLVADYRIDWRGRIPKVLLNYDQNQGRWLGVSRRNVADASQRTFDGLPLGQFREADELLPILLRNQSDELENPSSLYNIQISQGFSGNSVPLTQVIDSVDLQWEDPLIWRRDRYRTIALQAQPMAGVSLAKLQASMTAQIAEFKKNLPAGYIVEWGAEIENSAKSQKSLIPGMIPAFVLMFLIIVMLFNAIKPALIIFATIPLVLVGITAGFLGTGQAFGFMSILGALSLMGMMIKNAIVLIDEIKLNVSKGMDDYNAVIQAGLSRLNPVALAAATTIFGVLPLIQDVFWVSMAITIMAGLAFGTVLIMVVFPVLYITFYNIKKPKPE